jgi:hypothetical protein
MTDPTLFNGRGIGNQPYEPPNCQDVDVRFPSIPPTDQELLRQQHIETQLSSPGQRQRQDSFLSISSSMDSQTNVHCSYPVNPQPYALVAHTTPQGYPQRPAKMVRTASDLSPFSGQQQRNEHRAFSTDDSRPSPADMSRSLTHYSALSSGYTQQQRMSRPRMRPVQPPSGAAAWDLSDFENFISSTSTIDIPHNYSRSLANETDTDYNLGLENGEAQAGMDIDLGISFSTFQGSAGEEQRGQVCASNE